MTGAENAQSQVAAVLAAIPYARFIGVEAELRGDELTARLPYKPALIGNPMLPALHGGVVGAFMELTAIAQLALTANATRLPKTIGFSIDYLRSGRPLDTYARAHVIKVGRRIANVHVEAWQKQRDNPIAALRGNFLMRADLTEAPDAPD